MKGIIKKIPFVGDIAVKFYRKIKPISKFTTSGEYWDKRYREGGNSGAGSYNHLAVFKAEIINRFIVNKNIISVIELGCGDGNQLKYLTPQRYLGFDISDKAIELCNALYEKDDTKSFKPMNAYNGEKAELTMSLDVIYHLIEDRTYFDYMNTLFDASNKYVIIYSSNTDEKNLNTVHIKNRKFTDWVEKNQQDFKLFKYIPNTYSYNGDERKSSISDFFIYERHR